MKSPATALRQANHPPPRNLPGRAQRCFTTATAATTPKWRTCGALGSCCTRQARGAGVLSRIGHCRGRAAGSPCVWSGARRALTALTRLCSPPLPPVPPPSARFSGLPRTRTPRARRPQPLPAPAPPPPPAQLLVGRYPFSGPPDDDALAVGVASMLKKMRGRDFDLPADALGLTPRCAALLRRLLEPDEGRRIRMEEVLAVRGGRFGSPRGAAVWQPAGLPNQGPCSLVNARATHPVRAAPRHASGWAVPPTPGPPTEVGDPETTPPQKKTNLPPPL